jgi:hypothetical protein
MFGARRIVSTPQFKCPSCNSTLNKPVQYQTMGDVMRSAGTFTAIGGADALPCPVCGHSIPKMDIISGKLDPKPGAAAIVSTVVVISIIAFLLYKCAS